MSSGVEKNTRVEELTGFKRGDLTEAFQKTASGDDLDPNADMNSEQNRVNVLAREETQDALFRGMKDRGDGSNLSGGLRKRTNQVEASIQADQKNKRGDDDFLTQLMIAEIAKREAEEAYARAMAHYQKAEEHYQKAAEHMENAISAQRRANELRDELYGDEELHARARQVLPAYIYNQVKDDPTLFLLAMENHLLDENGNPLDPNDELAQKLAEERRAREEAAEEARKAEEERKLGDEEVEQAEEQFEQYNEHEKAIGNPEFDAMRSGLANAKERVDNHIDKFESLENEYNELADEIVSQAPDIVAVEEDDLWAVEGLMMEEGGPDEEVALSSPIELHESEEAFLADFQTRVAASDNTFSQPSISLASMVDETPVSQSPVQLAMSFNNSADGSASDEADNENTAENEITHNPNMGLA